MLLILVGNVWWLSPSVSQDQLQSSTEAANGESLPCTNIFYKMWILTGKKVKPTPPVWILFCLFHCQNEIVLVYFRLKAKECNCTASQIDF